MSVEVKNLSDGALEGYTFRLMVFAANGALKASRDAAGVGSLPGRSAQRVELNVSPAALGTGDRVVLAVKDVAWAGESWRSVPEDLLAAAQEAVRTAARP